MTYIAYFDGGCEPNVPGGVASYGAVIIEDDETIWKCSEMYSPEPGHERETSNNVAEYAGLITVLEWFTQRGLFDADITIRGDSLLAIQQMFGAWKIKKGIYTPLAYKARGLRAQFTNMRGEWIERDHNQIADGLAKAAVERAKAAVERARVEAVLQPV